MQLLEGRKAVVTGGSRGIGREICLLLAENGADVALAYRKSTVEAEQLREEIAAMGRSCIAVQADVSVSADVDRFVTQAAQALGGIDILVNCAGVFPQALIEDITDEDWSRVMRINLDGAFYACRAAAPYLKKSGKNGRIINLSSQAALNGTAHGVHYGASKAALLGLTYCLAKELGPDGITVNAILPGRIDTEMLAYATVVNLCEGCGTYTRYYFNTTSGKLTIGGTLNSSGDENNKSRNAKIELYEVNKSGAIDSYTVSQFTESTSLSHTFRNLSANKNYYIRIVNTTGWGGPFTDLWLGGTVSISQ